MKAFKMSFGSDGSGGLFEGLFLMLSSISDLLEPVRQIDQMLSKNITTFKSSNRCLNENQSKSFLWKCIASDASYPKEALKAPQFATSSSKVFIHFERENNFSASLFSFSKLFSVFSYFSSLDYFSFRWQKSRRLNLCPVIQQQHFEESKSRLRNQLAFRSIKADLRNCVLEFTLLTFFIYLRVNTYSRPMASSDDSKSISSSHAVPFLKNSDA